MSQTLPQPLRFDDRAAFRAWAEQQPRGRWERVDGVVVQMAPERAQHALVKARVWQALDTAIHRAGLRCQAFPDGMTVEIDDATDYEPDAVVSCGDRVDREAVAVPNPVIVVEVLSPSTTERDNTDKLDGYFRVPSIQHYLIFATDCVRVIHHRRWTENRLLTSICRDTTLDLDPPGMEITIADCYRDTGVPGAP